MDLLLDGTDPAAVDAGRLTLALLAAATDLTVAARYDVMPEALDQLLVSNLRDALQAVQDRCGSDDDSTVFTGHSLVTLSVFAGLVIDVAVCEIQRLGGDRTAREILSAAAVGYSRLLDSGQAY